MAYKMYLRMLARRVGHHIWHRHYSQTIRNTPLLNKSLKHLGKVRLISEDGKDCGIMNISEALRRSERAKLDLMQVSASEISVVKLVNYAELDTARKKNAYDARKRKKETKLMDRREGILKQVRLSPATDENDRNIKLRRAREFLEGGYRIRIYMQFRRGHERLAENAKMALCGVAEELKEVGIVQGLKKEQQIMDLFKEKQPKIEDGVPVKKKPLEVFMRPLPRKLREQKKRDLASD